MIELTDEVREMAGRTFSHLITSQIKPGVGFAWGFYEPVYTDKRVHLSLSRAMRICDSAKLICDLAVALPAVRERYGPDNESINYFTMRQLLFPDVKLKNEFFPNFVFCCGGLFQGMFSEELDAEKRQKLGLEYSREIGEAALKVNNSPCWFYSDFDFHGITQQSDCWNVERVSGLNF